MKFKDNIYTENYVKYCNNRRRRSLLVQFRLGILPLHFETSRFRTYRQKNEFVLFVVQLWKMNFMLYEFHEFHVSCGEYSQFREKCCMLRQFLHQILGSRIQHAKTNWTQLNLRFCENGGQNDLKSIKRGSIGLKIKEKIHTKYLRSVK